MSTKKLTEEVLYKFKAPIHDELKKVYTVDPEAIDKAFSQYSFTIQHEEIERDGEKKTVRIYSKINPIMRYDMIIVFEDDVFEFIFEVNEENYQLIQFAKNVLLKELGAVIGTSKQMAGIKEEDTGTYIS